MTKKITLSVPNELYEKMEDWKNSFNFSKVFQDEIATLIQKKEDFQNRLKGDPNMEQIIQRLKDQKATSRKSFYDDGTEEGLNWARAADYEELLYVTAPDFNIQWINSDDEVLGDYISDFISDNPILSIDANFNAWAMGWKTAVNEFWEQVKHKL